VSGFVNGLDARRQDTRCSKGRTAPKDALTNRAMAVDAGQFDEAQASSLSWASNTAQPLDYQSGVANAALDKHYR
jgi:hypothetical protein